MDDRTSSLESLTSLSFLPVGDGLELGPCSGVTERVQILDSRYVILAAT